MHAPEMAEQKNTHFKPPPPPANRHLELRRHLVLPFVPQAKVNA